MQGLTTDMAGYREACVRTGGGKLARPSGPQPGARTADCRSLTTTPGRSNRPVKKSVQK